MAKTYLDELVEYPLKALYAIGTNPTIVQLLTNNPNIDMDSDEADSVFDKYLFDYTYVDSTTQTTEAYICVEAEVTKLSSPTVKDMQLYVTIFCHKEYMELDPTKFDKLTGNRRDNLARYIDTVLSGTMGFGIGKLLLKRVNVVEAPTGFTGRELIYQVPDFSQTTISNGM